MWKSRVVGLRGLLICSAVSGQNVDITYIAVARYDSLAKIYVNGRNKTRRYIIPKTVYELSIAGKQHGYDFTSYRSCAF